jgi:chaperone LolA
MKTGLKFSTTIFLLVASFILLSVSVYADPTVSEIIDKVQTKYKKTNSAIVRYTQTVKFKLTKMEQSYDGTLFLKKEKMYRIETDQQTILTDGVTSWAFSPKTNQVVVDNYREDKNSVSPEKFLTEYPNDYYSNLVGKAKVNNKDTYEMKLTPKENTSFIKSLKVWVDSGEWFIRKIEIIDMNDNTTTYVVSKIEANIEIRNDKFQFKPTSETQVIDLR